MAIVGFNHYNITTTNLERTRKFYSDVLGLKDGERPPFSRPGAWMYIGSQPILHISTGRTPATQNSDAFDHVAFSATDIDGTRAHLRRYGIDFEEFGVPDRELHQIFFRDPDGVQIELQFAGEDARKAKATTTAVDSTRGRRT